MNEHGDKTFTPFIGGPTYEPKPAPAKDGKTTCDGCVALNDRPLCNRLPNCRRPGNPIIWVEVVKGKS